MMTVALFFAGVLCAIATIVFIDMAKDIFGDAIRDCREYRRKKKLWKKYR